MGVDFASGFGGGFAGAEDEQRHFGARGRGRGRM